MSTTVSTGWNRCDKHSDVRLDRSNKALSSVFDTVAAAQERIYSNFNAYASSITGAASGSPPAGLGFSSDLSDDLHYKISVGGLGSANQTYTLTATPQGVQAKDKCKNLTLDNTSAKDFSGDESNGKCW